MKTIIDFILISCLVATIAIVALIHSSLMNFIWMVAGYLVISNPSSFFQHGYIITSAIFLVVAGAVFSLLIFFRRETEKIKEEVNARKSKQ